MPHSEEGRKNKNDQIQSILLAVSRSKRERFFAAFRARMDRLSDVHEQVGEFREDEAVEGFADYLGRWEEAKIAEAAGQAAQEMHALLVSQAPRAAITVEDCVHFIFDALRST